MKMTLRFFLPMNPPTVTHQEKRVGVRAGKPIVYEDGRLADARQKLTAYLAPQRPPEPFAGAVRLTCKWCFPDKRGAHAHGAYKTTKPDTDNLNKLLKDCMTACHFWRDDAQVASEIIEKFWVRKRPGIYIEVTSLADVEDMETDSQG